MSEKNWVKFWQDGSIFTKIMEISADLFTKKSENYLNLKKSDVLLDIGCGYGSFSSLYGKVHQVCGVDTSQKCIEQCREKYRDYPEYSFYLLSQEDYLNFDLLGSKKFSVSIIFSVIQYYKNIGEVEKLIKEVQKRTVDGGILLIGDIAAGESSLKDVFSILGKSLRHGFFFTAISFFFNARFSSYYELSKQQGLLSISKPELEDLVKRLNLNAQIIPNLTLQSSRNNLLIRF